MSERHLSQVVDRFSEPARQFRLAAIVEGPADERDCDAILGHVPVMGVPPADCIVQRAARVPAVAGVDPFTEVLAAVQTVEADPGRQGRRRVAEALADDVRRQPRVARNEFRGCLGWASRDS